MEAKEILSGAIEIFKSKIKHFGLGFTLTLFLIPDLISYLVDVEHRKYTLPFAGFCITGIALNFLSWLYENFKSDYQPDPWLQPQQVYGTEAFECEGWFWLITESYISLNKYASSAMCGQCKVETDCFSDYKKRKIMISCSKCRKSKKMPGTKEAILQYVTNQYLQKR
jgi:hypothetical protein